jgi:hypothetical protein
MATRIFDAYTNYLALIATALPTLTAAGTVYDSSPVTIPTEQDFVVVGVQDLVTEGLQTSVDAGQQDWIDLGAYDRDETFTIPSVYVAWTGDNDLAGCRARASAQISLIESALRPPPAGTGDGMLNGALAPPNTRYGWCGVSITRLQQVADQDGTAVHVQFVLACRAGI